MKQKLGVIIILLVVGLWMGGQGTARAQDKTLFWERYDVNLTVQPNSDILVEEVQTIRFTSGTFRFGFASIPLDRVEQITDVRVSEIVSGSERPYTPNSSAPYGFTTFQNDSDLEITWYFPPTSNSEHTFVLRYRVIGGLRIYDEGDQLWWKAIAPDHNFPIRVSRITVTLPQKFPQDQLLAASYGATTRATYNAAGQVVFTAENIPADQELEVRVQFPHGVVQGDPPTWQAAEDRRTQWGPVVGLFSAVLGLMLLIGGPAGVYLLWYTRGRDKPVGPVPEYITEPPSDLPAALVGTLVDEKAELKDIIAAIIDLAHRGALRMEEKKTEGFMGTGLGASRDYIFHLLDPDKARYAHEKRLLQRIFGSHQSRSMRDLKEKFYTAIPKLRQDLYTEVVQLGFFSRNPGSIRTTWGCLGGAGLVAAGAVSFVLLALLGDYSPLAVCPGLGLVATMIALMVAGQYMPRKTEKGAEEAAKWLAFKRYLESIEKHTDLEAVKEKFETYLPYAVAFGLERRLIKKFAAVDAPAPTWWGPMAGPRYPYGHGHGPVYPGGSLADRPGPPGPLAGEGGTPSLAGMSEGIGTSLAAMSDSLGSMLSSVSSTLTSRPAPSGGGSSGGFGGGGWSGGGFGGGGGGGGGSRGFG